MDDNDSDCNEINVKRQTTPSKGEDRRHLVGAASKVVRGSSLTSLQREEDNSTGRQRRETEAEADVDHEDKSTMESRKNLREKEQERKRKREKAKEKQREKERKDAKEMEEEMERIEEMERQEDEDRRKRRDKQKMEQRRKLLERKNRKVKVMSRKANGNEAERVENPAKPESRKEKAKERMEDSDEEEDFVKKKKRKDGNEVGKKKKSASRKEARCEKCGKVFSMSSTMYRHIRNVHEDSKKYPCTERGCSYAASSAWDLKVHSYQHRPLELFKLNQQRRLKNSR